MVLLALFLIILLVIVFVVGAWFVGIYNKLVSERNEVKNSFSQIDVQLKRRYDLIPNLINTVKGYMTHERETLENITKLRQQAINISDDNVASKSKVESLLSQSLKSVFALAENYPDLKASQNFVRLQEELASTENKISFARQYYNDSVMKFNTSVELFPNSIVAGMCGFSKSEFFEVENPEERQNVKVSF